jgi:hypothetical protein
MTSVIMLNSKYLGIHLLIDAILIIWAICLVVYIKNNMNLPVNPLDNYWLMYKLIFLFILLHQVCNILFGKGKIRWISALLIIIYFVGGISGFLVAISPYLA